MQTRLAKFPINNNNMRDTQVFFKLEHLLVEKFPLEIIIETLDARVLVFATSAVNAHWIVFPLMLLFWTVGIFGETNGKNKTRNEDTFVAMEMPLS